MATHPSVLAWRIPGTGGPGGLLSMGSHRVGHDWSDLAVAVVSNYSIKQPLRTYYMSEMYWLVFEKVKKICFKEYITHRGQGWIRK